MSHIIYLHSFAFKYRYILYMGVSAGLSARVLLFFYMGLSLHGIVWQQGVYI
jgi:hypothetical protein